MQSRYLIKILFVSVLLLVAGGIGYLIGKHDAGSGTLSIQKPLVEISFSGGWLVDEENATDYYRIYKTGDVYMATRGGQVTLLGNVEKETIDELTSRINGPDLSKSFTKKERSFCDSAVDGIDSEISFKLTDGTITKYSSCDYTFMGDYGVLETVGTILDSVKEE